MIKQGDIFLVNLDPTVGHEIRKTRPAVVVSNNYINCYGNVVVIVPLTSNTQNVSPSHVVISKGAGSLDKDSKAVADHIKSVDKLRLAKKIGSLPPNLLQHILEAVDNTLKILPYPKS
ncbi:MAG: type II toxin-antitoxin system PemK/MazF family toxin [Candidatus Schekmanbacteria bacterium]|nr:type II toxin-antitoxin system PemK/MazF family toxin [Candidatus Schekmanbacteria bacterium]